MTNTLPLILLLTLNSTNWVQLDNDFKREGGTNFTKQWQVVTNAQVVEEIRLCTNRTTIHSTTMVLTNNPFRWKEMPSLNPPPLPGQFTKP